MTERASDLFREFEGALKKYSKNFAKPNTDCNWIGFREVTEKSCVRFVRDGTIQAFDTQTTRGVMVEVLVDGQFAYVATPSLDPDSLYHAALEARRQALSASASRLFSFSPRQRPPSQVQYTSQVKTPLSTLSNKKIFDTLIEITHRLKRSEEIVRTTAIAQTIESSTRLFSSAGAHARQEFSLTSSDFEATAQNGQTVQKRSDGGMRGRSFQGGWEFFLNDELWSRVDQVSKEALELLEAEECPNETLDLILMPDQMMLQIHESIGHPLEIDRILGDERNYAGWSFVKLEDFGSLIYGSPLMNVTFDPTIPEEFASYSFDDNGLEAKKEHLIQNGILIRGLGGIESQVRSQIPGVANARSCSWNRPPIDRMANLNLECGTSSFEDLISGVRRGVVMQTNRSWSIDDFRNKFQFGCEYAKLIENGKVTRTLRNPNYRGITVPFWKSLKKVGNRDTWGVFGTPFCGKGEPNQAIRVGHASPACLFEGIEVFGGAKA